MHGRYGNFIASVASLALLFIVSGSNCHASQNSISIRHSQVLSRHRPCLPEQRLETFEYGTRVLVRDLFSSMPVRVKQRAVLAAERSHLDKEWNNLVHEIMALLLPWSSKMNILLRDSVTQREIRFRSIDSTQIVSRTMRLFNQIGYTDDFVEDAWTPILATSKGVTIKGCICQEPSATKQYQFLSLGVQTISNEQGYNVLYEEVNKAFANSSFGIIEEGTNYDAQGKSIPKPRKGIERWPMFYLQIHKPEVGSLVTSEDISDDRGSDFPTIIDLLKAVSYGFLKKYSHRPGKARILGQGSVFSTQRKLGWSKTLGNSTVGADTEKAGKPSSQAHPQRSSRDESPFDGWPRIKVGHASTISSDQKEDVASSHFGTSTQKSPLIGESGKLLRKPFDDVLNENAITNEKLSSPRPTTFSSSSSSTSGQDDNSASRQTPTTEATPTGGQQENGYENLSKQVEKEPSPWLQDVLRSYNNPVFPVTQPPVHHLHDDLVPGTSDGVSKPKISDIGTLLVDSSSVSRDGTIDREVLQKAEVISQVDNKFILVKLPLSKRVDNRPQTNSSLVMLDQHACDERVKLEELMRSYFREDETAAGYWIPETEELGTPLVLEVSKKEFQILENSRLHFASWGVIFDVVPASDEPNKQRSPRIMVSALPRSIAERCRTETKLLFDLLRKESWKISENEQPPRRERRLENASPHNWVSLFHACPQGILDLLHSRSCRSKFPWFSIQTTFVANMHRCHHV